MTQTSKDYIGNPCAIVQIQIHQSIWPQFWITSHLSILELSTDTINFCFIFTG